MNAAKIESSRRLQRTLSALRTHGELSTRDLIVSANICAVNSVISELRANGFKIESKRRGGHWYYGLVEDSE